MLHASNSKIAFRMRWFYVSNEQDVGDIITPLRLNQQTQWIIQMYWMFLTVAVRCCGHSFAKEVSNLIQSVLAMLDSKVQVGEIKVESVKS